jgi:hypothetical protein
MRLLRTLPLGLLVAAGATLGAQTTPAAQQPAPAAVAHDSAGHAKSGTRKARRSRAHHSAARTTGHDSAMKAGGTARPK